MDAVNIFSLYNIFGNYFMVFIIESRNNVINLAKIVLILNYIADNYKTVTSILID